MAYLAALVWLAAGCALAAYWTRRRAAAGARELERAAERLGAGDYAARAHVPAGDQHAAAAAALNALASAVEETTRTLAQDRAQLSAILDSIVEAVAAVDAQGRLIAANPAMRALMGVSEAARGKLFAETLRHPKLQELLGSVLKESAPRLEEVTLFAPAERFFEAQAVPLRELGRPAGALIVLHDITRLRNLERLRREFVANVSHELRTPLASIRGFAETLRDGALEDKEHRLEFVEAIEKDAERLSALVEDLLDLSAIESGQRRPLLAPVALGELAREAARGLKQSAERARVTIAVEVADDLPAARADRGQMMQVLTNLLDNGVKFNKEGGAVSVSARAERGALVVEVRDTGPGIAPADLPRLFERFYRVDKARSSEVAGTGLGLAIVKHIVEAHGGQVSVDSRLDEGSCFRFTLPL